jgi:hypothetical protein
LSGAKSLDEIAYLWSKFILGELMARRERQEAALASYIFTFERIEDQPQLPIMPSAEIGLPPRADAATQAIRPETYAYLVLFPGIPMPAAAWDGPSPSMLPQERAEIPLGVPTELIDFSRPQIWWLNAVFVSDTIQATFCAGFDGETFGELKEIAGTHGGSLSSLCGIGAPEA